jgi:hypothetical protein
VSAFLASAPRDADNDPLEYIFGDLLKTFSESETAVLSALAHFIQPAAVEWIVDVAGIAEPAALTALEDLTDRALVVSDAEGRAFLLPPLAATFLRRKRPEAVSQAGDRFTDRVYALVLENGYTKYERSPRGHMTLGGSLFCARYPMRCWPPPHAVLLIGKKLLWPGRTRKRSPSVCVV